MQDALDEATDLWGVKVSTAINLSVTMIDPLCLTTDLQQQD